MERDDLLASPRGREFLTELAWDVMDEPRRSTSDAPTAAQFHYACGVIEDRREIDDLLWRRLKDCVASALYWQPSWDRVLDLAAAQLRPALDRLAQAVLTRPWPAWWSSPYDRTSQVVIEAMDESGDEPALRVPQFEPASPQLERWEAVRLQRIAQFAPEVTAVAGYRPAGGDWWSTPDVVATTRMYPGLGVAGLLLYEDIRTWRRAATWPVTTHDDVRIYEVTDVTTWLGLLTQSAIEVTVDSGPDWYEATGRRGRWEIPNWRQLARSYDAIHLTIDGYLRLAGNPIDTGRGTLTMVAGWAPDETYWLTDSFTVVGPSTAWVAYGHDEWRLEST
jgi:hypothetical protein